MFLLIFTHYVYLVFQPIWKDDFRPVLSNSASDSTNLVRGQRHYGNGYLFAVLKYQGVKEFHLLAPGSRNAGILFRFPHLFPYFNGCRRFSVTIMAVMQIFDGCRRPSATIENLVPAHIMQILMVAENLLQPSDGYRKPSATTKIRKQMRKLKQNTSVFFTHAGSYEL